MKRITIIISAFLIWGLQSCTDFLDIRPENETVLEDYWQSESQATAVLSSCYRGLATDACVERMIVWGELRSDNLEEGNSISEDMRKILEVNITPTNGYANWGSFYSVINYCNTFLYYAPNVLKTDQNFTPTKLHSLEAEALALRALCYFYLVRSFKEVPLILNPSINDTQDYYVPKSSERAILDQIIADLLEAQKYARIDYGKGAYNKGRITLNAVNALLADVYLWDQQYSNCVEACNRILDDKSLSLLAGDKMISDVFATGNSTESVLELQFDKDIQLSYTVNNFYGYEGEGEAGQFSFPVFLIRGSDYSPFNYAASSVKESEKDIREKHFFGTATNGNGYSIYKYAVLQCIEDAEERVTAKYRSQTTTANWVIYRLSDVMLMKAEALVQLDGEENLKAAMKMVNTTYLRSNTTVDSLQFNNYSDQGNMEKLVLRERQRELLFEGKRWFDLMRLVRRKNDPSAILAYLSPKLSGDAMSKNKLGVMDALYMPILKSELEININLTQNPFYTDENLSN